MEMIWPILNSALVNLTIIFLIASGFHLVMRVPKFLNIAHPDYATLGAYIIWTLAVAVGLSIWISLGISMLVVGIIAVVIDRFSFRYIRHDPLSLLLCSIGLGFIVRYGIYMIWSSSYRNVQVDLPKLTVSGTSVSGTLLLGLGFVVLITLAFVLMINFTSFGTRIRAVADNPQLAESFGIDREGTLRYLWFLSGATAPLGGFIVALYRPLTYDVCFHYLLLVIAVSILAGEKISFTRLLGASAIISGGIELGLFFLSEKYTMALGFIILIIAILVRRGIRR